MVVYFNGRAGLYDAKLRDTLTYASPSSGERLPKNVTAQASAPYRLPVGYPADTLRMLRMLPSGSLNHTTRSPSFATWTSPSRVSCGKS